MMIYGLLATQLVVTLGLTGLIWFVQVVHYPLFEAVGSGFPNYHRQHVRRTGWIVAPLMLAEGAVTTALAWQPPGDFSPFLAWLGLGLVLSIWTSTFTVQVPLHRRLERGFDAAVHGRLVRSNWLRTGGWTARGALAVWMVAAAAGW